MTERLQSIRPRLEELSRLDPDCLLGCGTDYELEPPLSEAQVLAFEGEHGVVLPTDYRRFLLEVGSAGVGPGYGLNPLGDMQHLNREKLPANFLAAPFPLIESFPEDSDSDESKSEDTSLDKWVTGAFCLSHWGCGMYDLLVVSGVERGHIWMDDRTNDAGVFPVAPNREHFGESQEEVFVFTAAEGEERTRFLDWYEWWLDWCFEEVKSLYEDE